MELIKYVRVLRRWAVLIAIGPILAAAAAGLTSSLLPKVYEAKVSLLVRPAQPLTVDTGVQAVTTDTISRTYAQLMTEPPLLQEVITDLNLKSTPDQLAKEVSITPQVNTTILIVSVQNNDPQLSADIANTLVDDFIKEIKQIEAQENANPNSRSYDNLVVVSPATKPDKPVSPNIPLNILIAAAAGLLLTLGLAFLVDYLDQSVKSDEDLAEMGLVPLGHVPFVAAAKTKRGEVVAIQPETPFAEAYKALRTNLLFSSLDREVKTIVVTSSAPKEGKSRTASNLAVALAQAGYRTLLVDCDFRRPSQHRIFGRVANLGVTNLILGDRSEEDVILGVEGVPRLWLIGSGPTPPNPSELLGSAKMAELLANFRQHFQYVVIDTPPANVVTDAVILAAKTDATLMVVEQGRATAPSVKHAMLSLERVGAKVAGAVVNKIRPNAASYYGYTYGYGYAYEYKHSTNGNGKVPGEVTPAKTGAPQG